MSTLISLELSVSSIGTIVATAKVSDAPYPFFFTTADTEKIRKSLEARRIRVPEKMSIITTPDYDKLVGKNRLRLV